MRGRDDDAGRERPTFAHLLVRTLASAGLLYGLVATALAGVVLTDGGDRLGHRIDGGTGQGANHGANHGADHRSATVSDVVERPMWRPADRRRFPDCVDIATWTVEHVPASVVVVRRGGATERMSFDEAFRRASSTRPGDDVWTIGACR